MVEELERRESPVLTFADEVPYSQKAEELVLGLLMTSASMQAELPHITEDQFFFDEHKSIYRAVCKCVESKLRPTPLAVSQKLKEAGAIEEMNNHLVSISTAASVLVNPKPVIAELASYAVRRKVIALCSDLVAKSKHNFDLSMDDIVAESYDIAMKLSNTGKATKFENSKDVSHRVVESMKVPAVRYSTGIKGLDKAMDGGLHNRRSYVLAARFKEGKTTLLRSVSYNLDKQGVKHVYIASEMDSDEIQKSNIARDVGVNPRMLDHKMLTASMMAKVEDSVKNMKSNTWYRSERGMNIDRLKRIILEAKATMGAKGVVFDYLQLLRSDDNRQGRASFLADAAQDIANICKDEDIFCLYAAQLNRDGEVRESDGALMAADQVYYMRAYEQEHLKSSRWLECRASRYTEATNVGSEDNSPGLWLNPNGVYFEDGY